MPYECDGDARQPVWRVSAATGVMRTTLRLDGMDLRAEQVTAAASAGWFVNPRLGASLSLGGLVAGRIDGESIGPGIIGSLSGSWLVRRERRWRPGPFVLLGASFAAASAEGYRAFDGRLGAAVGRTRGRWTATATFHL